MERIGLNGLGLPSQSFASFLPEKAGKAFVNAATSQDQRQQQQQAKPKATPAQKKRIEKADAQTELVKNGVNLPALNPFAGEPEEPEQEQAPRLMEKVAAENPAGAAPNVVNNYTIVQGAQANGPTPEEIEDESRRLRTILLMYKQHPRFAPRIPKAILKKIDYDLMLTMPIKNLKDLYQEVCFMASLATGYQSQAYYHLLKTGAKMATNVSSTLWMTNGFTPLEGLVTKMDNDPMIRDYFDQFVLENQSLVAIPAWVALLARLIEIGNDTWESNSAKMKTDMKQFTVDEKKHQELDDLSKEMEDALKG